MNDCENKFHYWMSKAYSKLPKGEDFPSPDDFMFEVWQAAWRSAYSTGVNRGHRQRATQWHVREERKTIPMPYWQMEDLFSQCQTGREFGQKLEEWHGIGL